MGAEATNSSPENKETRKANQEELHRLFLGTAGDLVRFSTVDETSHPGRNAFIENLDVHLRTRNIPALKGWTSLRIEYVAPNNGSDGEEDDFFYDRLRFRLSRVIYAEDVNDLVREQRTIGLARMHTPTGEVEDEIMVDSTERLHGKDEASADSITDKELEGLEDLTLKLKTVAQS